MVTSGSSAVFTQDDTAASAAAAKPDPIQLYKPPLQSYNSRYRLWPRLRRPWQSFFLRSSLTHRIKETMCSLSLTVKRAQQQCPGMTLTRAPAKVGCHQCHLFSEARNVLQPSRVLFEGAAARCQVVLIQLFCQVHRVSQASCVQLQGVAARWQIVLRIL